MKNIDLVLREMSELPPFVGVNLNGPNVRGNFGDYPLHVAVVQQDLEAVRVLLDAGANVNSQGEHGYTPLHEAIEQGAEEIVALLLERGASNDIKNDDGLTPGELAALLAR